MPLKKETPLYLGFTVSNGGMCPNGMPRDTLAYSMLMNYNPRHVPSLLGPVYFDASCVLIDHPNDNMDDATDTAYDPLITWWRESKEWLAFEEMPADHAKAKYRDQY